MMQKKGRRELVDEGSSRVNHFVADMGGPNLLDTSLTCCNKL
jgi:hypothetical protein